MEMNGQVGVKKLLLQESSTYNKQYRRPLQTTIDADVTSLIVNRFKSIKGQVATGAIVSGVAESFLMPSMQPDKEIVINGGWSQKVYRALLEVEVRSETGHSIGFVITAFSDPFDNSMQGSVNPRMPFYITNIVQLRRYVDRTQGVAVPVTALGSASQLLADNKFGGFNSNYDFRLRPMDVFSFIGQQALDLGTPQSEIYDERTILTQMPVKSEVKNQLPGVYVSKVLGAYKSAFDSSGEIGGTGFDQLAEAQGLVTEQESATDFFLRALRDIRAPGHNDTVNNSFTLEELQRLSPNDQTRHPRVIPLSRDVQNMRAQGPGQNWSTAKPLQRMASYLKDTIPALMMENMMMRAIIHCSNRLFADGRLSAQIKDWGSFSDVDISSNIVSLEQRIIKEILMPLSEQNTRAIDIDMVVLVDSDSRFSISFDGCQHEEFVAPTFAGAMLTPVLTSNPQSAFTMANDFKALGDMLADAGTQLPTMKNAVFQVGRKSSF